MTRVTLVLAIALTATVCAAAVLPGDRDLSGANDNLNNQDTIDGRDGQHATIQRRPRTANPSSQTQQTALKASCFSLNTNDSHPAAHIVGYNREWNTLYQRNSSLHGYKTHWNCNSTMSGAYVDGGMYFNQTNTKLHVPKCGYYYISSQVQFSQGPSPTTTQAFVHHQLLVEPNCDWSAKSYQIDSRAVNGTGRQWATTTHASNTFKLCKGGKVFVIIPYSKNYACCSYGISTSTFFSAHLVRETDCGNPSERMHDHMPTEEDYQLYYDRTNSISE